MFANSSCSVSVMDAKLGLITRCHTGSIIRGWLKTRYGQEECCTGCHCYENRRHAFRAFTDGECEILDTLLCVKKAVQCPRGDARALWHARHLGGPLCTNKLLKNCMCCGLPKPNCQTACSAAYSRDNVICIWPKAI